MVVVRDVGYAYPTGEVALKGVSLSVAPGERVVLMGRNGSGKSTVARLLNGALLPQGGSVEVDGVASGASSSRALARLVGYVRQDPRCQIVSPLVSDEVAFGPRNLGLSREEVLGRVREALEACGISALSGRLTSELSGGQQQLLALAGVLAMRPGYLVLDEACAQLDEASRARVRRVVDGLVREGMGVLEIAHDVPSALSATRVVVLEGGEVAWEGAPRELFASERALAASGLAEDLTVQLVSAAVRGGYALDGAVDPADLGGFLRARSLAPRAAARGHKGVDGAREGHELRLEGVRVSYGDVSALDGASLVAAPGITLVLGRSGSGKTTAARVLAGVLEPDEGRALLDGRPVRAGRVGLAFQRPEDQVFADTVLEDISFGPQAQGSAPAEARELALAAARELDLGEGLLDRSPFELSGGQLRRVALAGAIAARPPALVLDEPTAGLDAGARARLRALARRVAGRGAAVVVVTHDPGEWLDDADEVAFVRDGVVTEALPAASAASDVSPYLRSGLEPSFDVLLRAALEGGSHA